MLHNNGHSSIDPVGLAALKDHSWSDPLPFTEAEYTIGTVLKIFHELHTIFFSKQPLMGPEPVDAYICNIVESLERYVSIGSRTLESNMQNGMNASALLGESLQIPMWSYFHSMYSYLELWKFLAPLLDYVLAENRKCKYVDATWLSSKAAILREEGKKLSASVRLSATELSDKLRGPAVLQQFTREVIRNTEKDDVEDVIGTELDLLGNECIEVCKDLQESWIEALDGIIRTK